MAFAYYSLDPVDIGVTDSIGVTTGSSLSIDCSINPTSEAQLPGCGMAECPQGCGDITAPNGIKGGCQDENGWCTCTGTTYSTYYTDVSVYSSNSSVARASWNGGVLNVTGYSAGSATITVNASLSKHQDASATVNVEVSDPAVEPDPGSGGSANTSTSTSTATSTGTSAGSSTGISSNANVGGSAVTVTAAGVPEAATVATATEEKNETVINTGDGTQVIIVQANSAVNCAEELAKVAGTEGSVTFWVGESSDKPDISWTFKGTDLDPAGNLNMDLGVLVSEKGTGSPAQLLAGARDSIVVDWTHRGALPGKATVYVRTAGRYADGTALSLYCLNDTSNRFELAQQNIVTANGYATYEMDHCSVWALSTQDLAQLTLASSSATSSSTANATSNAAVVDDIAKANTQDATGGAPWIALIVGVLAVLAAAAVAAAVFARRRRNRVIEPTDAARTDDPGDGGDAE